MRPASLWPDCGAGGQQRFIYRSRIRDDRQGFYGIVEADVTATTVVAASVMYQKSEFNNHYGVPMGANGADLGLPRARFFGVGSGNSTRQQQLFAQRGTELPADWLMKAAYTHTQFSVDKVAHFLIGTLNPITGNGLSVSGQFTQREFASDVLDVCQRPFSATGSPT